MEYSIAPGREGRVLAGQWQNRKRRDAHETAGVDSIAGDGGFGGNG